MKMIKIPKPGVTVWVICDIKTGKFCDIECDVCKGEKYFYSNDGTAYECPKCDGIGSIKMSEETVKVPYRGIVAYSGGCMCVTDNKIEIRVLSFDRHETIGYFKIEEIFSSNKKATEAIKKFKN